MHEAEQLRGWELLPESQAATFRRGLARELPLGHALASVAFEVIATGLSHPDDLLLRIDATRQRYAVVHRTWRVEADPRWPHTVFYDSLEQVELGEEAQPPVAGRIDDGRRETTARSASSPRLSAWQATFLVGAVCALAQFGAFDCNGVPALSASAGFVAGAAGTGAVVCFRRSWWIGAFLLLAVTAIAGGVTVFSHLCG
jgi:hypothetical protein